MMSQDDRLEASIRKARIRQGEGKAPVLGSTGIHRMGDLPDGNTVLMGFPLHISFIRYQSLFSLEMMEQLGSRWHLRFGALKKYMEEYGEEPRQDTEYGGFKIGAWLQAQRTAYRKGKLSDEREELLDQLNIQWGAYRDTERSWIHHMAACIKFLDREDKLPVMGDESPDRLKIGQWLTHQRRFFREGHLRDDRKQALEKFLGDVLDPKRTRWERNLAALKDYLANTGKWPERRTIHNGVAIGNWLTNTIRPNKKKLPADLIQRLDELGVRWEPIRDSTRTAWSFTAKKEPSCEPRPIPARPLWTRIFDDSWYTHFAKSRSLMMEAASLKSTDTIGSLKVGEWFECEKHLCEDGALSPLKRAVIGSLGLINTSKGLALRQWYWHYSLCLEYLMEKPSVLKKGVTFETVPIGNWFEEQVSCLGKGRLYPAQEDHINELIRFSQDRDLRKLGIGPL